MKVEEIKAQMGFRRTAPMCGNCKHFTCKKETFIGFGGGKYTMDKNLRCLLGGFKVGKSNWCQKYEAQ